MKRFVLILLLFYFTVMTAFAHGGSTDEYGGHVDWDNGEYHYHHGYPAHSHDGGYCPYRSGSSVQSSATSLPTYAEKIIAVDIPDAIYDGDTYQLRGDVYPSNAQDSSIEWKSENPEIVTVTSSGLLHAVGIGKATIIAKTSRSTSTVFTINVKEILAKNIKITDKPQNILIDSSLHLNVTFLPENTSDKTVEWTSDNPDVLSVSNNGKITAKSVGSAKITVKHRKLSDSFVVDVLPIEPKEIKITYPVQNEEMTDANKNSIKKGQQIDLSAEVFPNNTTDKTVTWSVIDTSVAEIDKNGKLTALHPGKTTIIATASNGIQTKIDIEVYSHTIKYIIGSAGTALAGGTYMFLKKRKNDKKAP